MLNRKGQKPSGAKTHRRSQEPEEKPRPVRHRFIISSKSAMQSRARAEETRASNGHSKPAPGKAANGHSKAAPQQKGPNQPEQNPTFTLQSSVDLTETIK